MRGVTATLCALFAASTAVLAIPSALQGQLHLTDPKPEREPDFVDVLQAEADRAGVTIDWGLDHVAQKANEAAFKLNKAKQAQDAQKAQDAMQDSQGSTKLNMLAPPPTAGGDVQPAQPGSGWVWASCGLDADAVRVDRVDVVPDLPKPGQSLTVKGAGLIRSLVDEGTYIDVVVKLGLIKLLSKRFDLCEIARENDAQLQCPLQPGYYEIEHTVQLPREIPPAKFNVHLTGTSQTELDLVCLDLSIDFLHR